MTEKKFEQAKMLEERIKSIEKLIGCFSTYDYRLEPPTRMSSYSLWRGSQKEIVLNEAEAVLFKNALVDEKSKLQKEFERL